MAVSYREGVYAGRAVKLRGVGVAIVDFRLGHGVVRVGYVHHLDAVVVGGGHYRIVAVAYLVDGHAPGVLQLEVAVVLQLAGGEDVVRVGDIHNLDAVVAGAGHHYIRASPHAIDGHPVGPLHFEVVGVRQVAGGGGVVGVGDIYNLYAALLGSRHHRVVPVVGLVVRDVKRATEQRAVVVGDLAPVGRIAEVARVGHIHYPDGMGEVPDDGGVLSFNRLSATHKRGLVHSDYFGPRAVDRLAHSSLDGIDYQARGMVHFGVVHRGGQLVQPPVAVDVKRLDGVAGAPGQ